MKRVNRVSILTKIACTIIFICLSNPSASANDIAGCSDVGGLRRFIDSSIVMCERHDFDTYTLPTGKNTGFDFDSNKVEFESSMNIEGRLVENVYAIPPAVSSVDVFRNYKADLAANGYRILFQAERDATGPHLGSFFETTGPGTQIWGYSPDQARYIAAVREDGGAKTYIALYVIEYQDGYDPNFSPQKGQAMVRLDAVQVGALEDRMVPASAADISKDFEVDGKAALYGILFDFDKATIKPESRPALDEIAKFLQQNPAQKVYLIGHTDSVGGFDFNMQLSKARAAAVVDDLSRTYHLETSRMMSSGVGLQAPVASNATQEGRARNRRVEMVPQ